MKRLRKRPVEYRTWWVFGGAALVLLLHYFFIHNSLSSQIDSTPTQQEPFCGDIRQIEGGGGFICMLKGKNEVQCLGRNDYGQLGIGNTKSTKGFPDYLDHHSPSSNLGFDSIQTISSGLYHSCAISGSGQLKCWGRGLSGELGLERGPEVVGDGPGEMGRFLPVIDLGVEKVLAVSAGHEFTCAIVEGGRVKCFGKGQDGRLGSGSTESLGLKPGSMGRNLPFVDLGENQTAENIVTGRAHACAVLQDSTLKCWGSGEFGQIGSGSPANIGDKPGQMGDRLPFVDLGLNAVRPVDEIATGNDHTCVKSRRGLKCFGRNDFGQLGIGPTANKGVLPTDMGRDLKRVYGDINLLVLGVSPYELTSGSQTTCIGTEKISTLRCWGRDQAPPSSLRISPPRALLPEDHVAGMQSNAFNTSRYLAFYPRNGVSYGSFWERFGASADTEFPGKAMIVFYEAKMKPTGYPLRELLIAMSKADDDHDFTCIRYRVQAPFCLFCWNKYSLQMRNRSLKGVDNILVPWQDDVK